MLSWDIPPLKTLCAHFETVSQLSLSDPWTDSDAFPKVSNTYRTRSSKGGFATVVLAALIGLLVWHELQLFLYGDAEFSFSVNKGVGHHLQVNVDLTVAMPCHCGSIHWAHLETECLQT